MAQDKLNLNRSFSEPDIHSNYSHYRHVVVHEVYHTQSYGQPLIRQHSCSQILKNSGNADGENNTTSIINVHVQNYNLGFKNNPHGQMSSFAKEESYFVKPNMYKNKNMETTQRNRNDISDPNKSLKEYLPMEETPMDVDDYNPFEKEIEHDNILAPELDHLSKRNIRKLNDLQIKTKEKNVLKAMLLAFAILALCLAYYWPNNRNFSTFLSQQNEHVIKKYVNLNKILYQDHVKEKVIENLEHVYNKKHKRILVFVGTTGVGKTYTANIIHNFFPKTHSTDVNFLINSQLTDDHLEISLNRNGCHFIVIDNLKIENLNDVLLFIRKIPEKCVLIIPIFNIHEVDENLSYTVNYHHFEKIKIEFSSKVPNADVILFNDINRDNLEIWLREQIKDKDFNEEDAIISLLNEHDVEKYGFKGLLAKFSLLKP